MVGDMKEVTRKVVLCHELNIDTQPKNKVPDTSPVTHQYIENVTVDTEKYDVYKGEGGKVAYIRKEKDFNFWLSLLVCSVGWGTIGILMVKIIIGLL